jgi:hypothetical protein
MPGELDAVLACGEVSCAGISGPELIACGAELCGEELDALAT